MEQRRSSIYLYTGSDVMCFLNSYILSNIENNNNQKEKNMEQKIKDALEQIRPFLQRDGGDIEFVEYTEDNVVKVRLQGHCAGCPGAQMTIKGVVERILKESYPEIKAVESV